MQAALFRRVGGPSWSTKVDEGHKTACGVPFLLTECVQSSVITLTLNPSFLSLYTDSPATLQWASRPSPSDWGCSFSPLFCGFQLHGVNSYPVLWLSRMHRALWAHLSSKYILLVLLFQKTLTNTLIDRIYFITAIELMSACFLKASKSDSLQFLQPLTPRISFRSLT